MASPRIPDTDAGRMASAKMKPSKRRREARRLREHLEAASAARRDGYAQGDEPEATSAATADLAKLEQRKRVFLRDVYAAAPKLEGQPVYRRPAGGGR